MDKLTIERACERLILDFAYYSDHQEYESLAALFANEGVIGTMHRPAMEPVVGREAILKAYQARRAGRMTRHVCSNMRITVESEDRAHGITYAVVYSATGDEKAEERIGEFEDEFVRTSEGWRFAVRRARFVMHM